MILSLLALALTVAAAQGSMAMTAQGASSMPDRTRGPASALVGNRIEVRYGDQMMVSSFAADGTFKMTEPDGRKSSGDWVADDRHVCWITKVPKAAPGGNVRCEANLAANRKIGDTWSQMDSYGQKASVTLVRGQR